MLTTATVRELKPRDKMYEVTCSAMHGFVVRVLPTGRKVFLVRHQVDGQWRREKIGRHEPVARRRRGAPPGGADAGRRASATSRPSSRPRAAPRRDRRAESSL
jgi:hypothetical protein